MLYDNEKGRAETDARLQLSPNPNRTLSQQRGGSTPKNYETNDAYLGEINLLRVRKGYCAHLTREGVKGTNRSVSWVRTRRAGGRNARRRTASRNPPAREHSEYRGIIRRCFGQIQRTSR